ncbi:OmpH family outer membrane protein [Vibrio rumoiensis]|uniref:Chaperone protein skp n=1 Tax=Vibrio rumoiensis 1S-45 TaxID=1188252 RepID=A0A1E5E0K0_9VIBR|nr:OmpH family outer membrane protein [Vibrio rumoiensis]OEF23949.1 molecular chaperone [Vibrio rumoiensis 1S-45]
MKKFIKVAGISLVILTSSLAATAAQAAEKVGYVNTAKVFQTLPQREAIAKKLQSEFKDQKAQLDSIQKKIQTKMDKARRDGQLLSEDDMRKLQIEIGTLQAEYKVKGQALERDAQKREGAEKQKLFVKIQDAVKKVSEQQGYDMIIDAQALQYAKPGSDITDSVIKALK